MTSPAILVLEDDDLLRELLVDLLNDDGFAVLAETALPSSPADTPVGLVLTDSFLPIFQPEEAERLIASIRSLYPDVPIILLTGHAKALASDPAAIGAAAVIQKPFDLDDLLAVVNRYLPGGKS